MSCSWEKFCNFYIFFWFYDLLLKFATIIRVDSSPCSYVNLCYILSFIFYFTFLHNYVHTDLELLHLLGKLNILSLCSILFTSTNAFYSKVCLISLVRFAWYFIFLLFFYLLCISVSLYFMCRVTAYGCFEVQNWSSFFLLGKFNRFACCIVIDMFESKSPILLCALCLSCLFFISFSHQYWPFGSWFSVTLNIKFFLWYLRNYILPFNSLLMDILEITICILKLLKSNVNSFIILFWKLQQP